MLKFILKRVSISLITIWVIISVTFLLMHAAPGDPFRKENKMPAGVYENLRKKYGLDKPKSEQYVIYLKNILKGDFGASMKSKTETVNQMISRGFPISARLGIQALFTAVFFGILLGTFAALYQNKFPDYFAMITALIGISVPSFIMGILLLQFIAKGSSFFPMGGWGEFKHTLLPAFAMALMPMAQIARLMRSSMLEVMGQDYIKTARSKGLPKFLVIWRHAIKNSILPVVSMLGVITANLLVGSFIIERIFAIPGLGKFFVSSISNRDYPLIMGTTVFYGIILVTMLLITDICYTLVDPRIKVVGDD
ncbi:MAG: ABC transporter permease [Tissierellia bacterium]|nr:ABC transporter permease [Tissierellia bacterium]